MNSQEEQDVKLDEFVNGNKVDHPAKPVEKKVREFKKTAHLFAHRKQGAQMRFQKLYVEMKQRVEIAYIADLLALDKQVSGIAKSNEALAMNRKRMVMEKAQLEAMSQLGLVFKDWRLEVERICNELGGWIQDDGQVVFKDGSQAKMPNSLYIKPEDQLKF